MDQSAVDVYFEDNIKWLIIYESYQKLVHANWIISTKSLQILIKLPSGPKQHMYLD